LIGTLSFRKAAGVLSVHLPISVQVICSCGEVRHTYDSEDNRDFSAC